MAKFLGRAITLTWGGAAIAGVREKGISLEGEAIDVSDDDSAGWRELLSEHGEKMVNLSLSGVTKTDALKEAWFNGTLLDAVVLTYPDGGIIAGNFLLPSYADTGPYKDSTTFECELQSSGVITYTPAP